MKKYYHLNERKLSAGDILQPGSMGKIINENYILYGNDNERAMIWRLFQEQTFELIRLKHYPEHPSRLKSIFLFETIEESTDFLKKDNREGCHLYEVEIISDKMIHRCSMKLYERIPHSRPVLPALELQAHQYWQGINTIDTNFEAELLVESEVRIVKKINTV